LIKTLRDVSFTKARHGLPFQNFSVAWLFYLDSKTINFDFALNAGAIFIEEKDADV